MQLNRLPVSEQIFEDIVQKIRTRQILPGEKLVIKKLEEEYQVSSTPIRDALGLLKSYGFVDAKISSTASVIRMSPAERRDVVELNKELTNMSFRLLMQNNKAEEIREKMRPLYQKQLALKNAPFGERIAAYIEFVNVPGQNTGNSCYSTMIGVLYGKSVVAFGDYSEVYDPDSALENSRQIMEALECGDWERFGKLRHYMMDCFSELLDREAEEEK